MGNDREELQLEADNRNCWSRSATFGDGNWKDWFHVVSSNISSGTRELDSFCSKPADVKSSSNDGTVAWVR